MERAFEAGRDFLLREGRLLERRLFSGRFEAPAPIPGATAGVVDALRGYQNADGGFGHGLEPDKLCPASLPIDVEVALQSLCIAGATDDAMVSRACDYLGGVAERAGVGGGVPLAFPIIEAYPRAPHWTEWTYEPGLNPTAGLVGWLYALGAGSHPFVTQAEAWCWERLDDGLPDDVHALSEALVFLERQPEERRRRADSKAADVVRHLAEVPTFHADPAAAGYGLTPLHMAPLAQSRWRALFAGSQIDAHLDALERAQRDDGGWPITWDPPGTASLLAWRGVETLRALRTLTSYGRLDPH